MAVIHDTGTRMRRRRGVDGVQDAQADAWVQDAQADAQEATQTTEPVRQETTGLLGQAQPGTFTTAVIPGDVALTTPSTPTPTPAPTSTSDPTAASTATGTTSTPSTTTGLGVATELTQSTGSSTSSSPSSSTLVSSLAASSALTTSLPPSAVVNGSTTLLPGLGNGTDLNSPATPASGASTANVVSPPSSHSLIFVNSFPKDFPVETQAGAAALERGKGYVFLKNNEIGDSMLLFLTFLLSSLAFAAVFVPLTKALERRKGLRREDAFVREDMRWAEGREVLERRIVFAAPSRLGQLQGASQGEWPRQGEGSMSGPGGGVRSGGRQDAWRKR